MEEEFVFRSTFAEMEEEFHRFRESTIEEYESELKRLREEWKIQLEEGPKIEEETRRSLMDSGVDVDRLDEIEESTQRRLDEFLNRVRPQFIERDPQFRNRLRKDMVRLSFHSLFGCSQANLIGADLLVPDIESLEGIEGEIGNPSVWLHQDQKNVKDKSVAKGTGSGLWAYGHVPYAHTTVWYYSWIPPKSRKYWIVATIDYHGFYVLYSNDKWYNNKDAEVHAYTDIELYQYFPRGRIERRIIDKAGDNISEAGLLDGYKSWSFHENLSGGDAVFFRVRFALDTNARGGGSHAELNFSDGKANYISAPVVMLL